MPKKATELGPLAVSRLAGQGFHAVGGVAGLGLQIVPSGAKSWVLRVTVGGKRRKMGLGGYPDVTLANARVAARDAMDKVRKGVDPIDEGRAARRALVASRAKEVTFKQCAERYIEVHKGSWKNEKHEAQWSSTLVKYAFPVIGDLWVRDVSLEHIKQILEPIWKTKTETAKRLRGRIEVVLDSAITQGFRDSYNPARWVGNLNTIFPAPTKIKKVTHFRAVPVKDVPTFVAALRTKEGVAARALEFLILTNVRFHNVRHASWSEIDWETKTWTIPGEDGEGESKQRMKTGKAHRVPLAEPALELMKSLPRIEGCDFIFPSPRKNAPLSDMAMNKLMRDMEASGVPHGFRSSFRDWAAEHTNFSREVTEKAMAHQVGDRVEASYLRSDLFAKRRKLMDRWGEFLSNKCR